jgi:putative transposase
MSSRHRKLCHRYHEPGDAHELTFSCYHRLPLLASDCICQWLVEEIDRARRELNCHVWAYVLMPEHVHLLVWPVPAVFSTDILLKKIKQPVAQKALAFFKKQGSEWLPQLSVVQRDGKVRHCFWQAGGGYDRNVREPRTALEMATYMHNNPVRRGLVNRPEDWQWSSARWYAGHRPVPIAMDGNMAQALG